MNKVLLIYTGGTIGMKEDPADQTLRPFDFGSLMEEVPELRKFALKIDSYTFDPLIDSSDIEPGMWQKLAGIIERHYEAYDGFVVLHGTDTMAYSASALSYMLQNLSKPVVFTGSQLPIGRLRTDGRENLVSAVEIAGSKLPDGSATVPEVCIYFNSLLLRGNRSTKVDADGFDAFRSPNMPPLAEAGIDIRFNHDLIRRPSGGEFGIGTALDTRVSILKVHPGITEQVVKDVLLGSATRAVILETFGCGNAPSRDWFLDIIRQASDSGKILLNVTQCLRGTVNMDLYATGRALSRAGVLSGYDITLEGALGKLFFLMGKNNDNEYVKSYLERNLRGEITK
ncbi:MAG: type I asparaginase [Bacteroidales bacterium]|nr:type I asparaginase [Bacteroidales bacterium]MBO4566002.1 type I asparaginase [Bacteroidales bacterium]